MDDSRLLLTDAIWERLAAALSGLKSRAGAPPKQSDRDFIEAVLYLARTGEPWRDLPERFGKWDAVYQRFRRWEKAGRWRALFERLPADLQEVHTIFFDSSVIRAHPHAAGAPKKKGARMPRPWAAVAVASGPRSTPWLRMSGRLSPSS
jgi:transposase